MSRRFYKRCLLWLLPLLVAQSLVPVGFMVGAGEQGVVLGFCPVQSARVLQVLESHGAAAIDHSAHANHVGHHADAAPASTSTDDQAPPGACPYALTRNAIADAPIAAVVALSLIQVGVLRSTERLPILQNGPSALNRIRGPPQHLA